MSDYEEYKDLWMQTNQGVQFYPYRCTPEMINIFDVAWALSNQPRYNGHLDKFYSVAEHSVYTSYLVEPHNALCALLHDATEAYIGDMPSPVKKGIPQFNDLEDYIWKNAIAPRFGLPHELPEDVKQADFDMLTWEYHELVKDHGYKWICSGSQKPFLEDFVHVKRLLDKTFDPLDSQNAVVLFLKRYIELVGGALTLSQADAVQIMRGCGNRKFSVPIISCLKSNIISTFMSGDPI